MEVLVSRCSTIQAKAPNKPMPQRMGFFYGLFTGLCCVMAGWHLPRITTKIIAIHAPPDCSKCHFDPKESHVLHACLVDARGAYYWGADWASACKASAHAASVPRRRMGGRASTMLRP